METRWLYRTSENLAELREEAKGVCVIPIGCVEKHGLHLPLGQDIIQAGHIAWQASQLEPVCVFADFSFGDIQGKKEYMPLGSVIMPVELEMQLLEVLCDNISNSGFKKIILFNGHGGNKPWLSTFMRSIKSKDKDYALMMVNIELSAPHRMAKLIEKEGRECVPEMTDEDIELVLKYHKEGMLIGHGGFGETSYMMAISPESVCMDRLGIETGKDNHKTDYLMEAGVQLVDAGWAINFPNAFTGDDPIGCNERIGAAALRLEVERVAKAFKVVKEDENILGWMVKDAKKL